jgi:hypothetical protein
LAPRYCPIQSIEPQEIVMLRRNKAEFAAVSAAAAFFIARTNSN